MRHTIVVLFSLILMVGCRSSQTTASQTKASLPEDEVEIEVPCSGPDYFTNSEFFRANSMGESMSMSVSKMKAMSNVRAELAAAVQTTVKTVTDNYVNSQGSSSHEELHQKFESLNREVVSQKLSGIRVICERYFKTAEGNYKTYVAVELSAQQLVDAYQQRLSSSQESASDFDYEKFKSTFAEEMGKMERQSTTSDH